MHSKDDKKVMIKMTKLQKRPITIPANIYLLQFNNRNAGKMSETGSKLTIKTPERRRSEKQI